MREQTKRRVRGRERRPSWLACAVWKGEQTAWVDEECAEREGGKFGDYQATWMKVPEGSESLVVPGNSPALLLEGLMKRACGSGGGGGRRGRCTEYTPFHLVAPAAQAGMSRSRR